jgi:hypothetical protein
VRPDGQDLQKELEAPLAAALRKQMRLRSPSAAGQITSPYNWYDAHGVEARTQDQANSGNPMKRNEFRFVACVKDKSYAAALELRKLYQVVADETAAKLHQIRVIDESGEDYLYPEEYFVPVELPQSAEKAVRRAAGVRN